MDVYQGCLIGFFVILIGAVSVLLALSLGLFGLLLPSVLVGFCYLLVDTILVELMWWDRDRNQ